MLRTVAGATSAAARAGLPARMTSLGGWNGLLPLLRHVHAGTRSQAAAGKLNLAPGSGRRLLCVKADVATRLKNAHMVLGLKPGASRKEIKLAYYGLARQTHPDSVRGSAMRKANADAATGAANAARVRSSKSVLQEDDGVGAPPASRHFLEVQEAFETLIEALDNPEAFAAGEKKAAGSKQRAKTLGEVLCERLVDEPDAVDEIWAELKEQQVQVTGPVLDALLRACAAGHGSAGFDKATAMLEEGEEHGLFSLGVRQSGVCSLLDMCTGAMSEDDTWDAEVVINQHVNDTDRGDPGVIAAIGAVYCSGTRSPF